MSADAVLLDARKSRGTWKSDLLLAFAATLLFVAVSAIGDFSQLRDARGDNDSLMRLVEVRDLLAGQGWFDLHQYRMGPEGGIIMHWSRLVDAPIALIMLAASAFTDSMADAESVARVAWPAITFCATLFFLMRAARSFGNELAAQTALIIGAFALVFLKQFGPGALDHHNVQLMLASASMALLLDDGRRGRTAFGSGLCAALMLGVGMETAPYVAALGLCAALLFGFGEDAERIVARAFGLGFASTSALILVATVPASNWGEAHCDAFSSMQFVLAAIGGIGLAGVASIPFLGRTRTTRLLSLGGLAMSTAAVIALAYPECLAAPYAAADPRLHKFWLDHISEARSLPQLIRESPVAVPGRYATPLLALVLMLLKLRKSGWRRQDVIVTTLLVMAFLISLWQVRGSTFSVVFAVVPLAAWVAPRRERVRAASSVKSVLSLIAVWLLSLNVVWIAAAAAVAVALGKAPTEADGTKDARCERAETFAHVAAQPATTVLAISNLGSAILTYSGHRALSGPYHRNLRGNLLALDAFLGSAEQARGTVKSQNIGLVALCPGSPETRLLTKNAPDGFLARLVRGDVPPWLEPITQTRGEPIELFRVRPGS